MGRGSPRSLWVVGAEKRPRWVGRGVQGGEGVGPTSGGEGQTEGQVRAG